MEEINVLPSVRNELTELLRNNYLLAATIFDAYPLPECDTLVDLIHRFYAGNDLESLFLKATVEREIRRTRELSNLLRLNTLATKLLTRMCRKGKFPQIYLRSLLHRTVTRTVTANLDLEVDPTILKEKKVPEIEAHVGENMRKLDSALRELLEDIFGSQNLVPKEIREMCMLMRDLTSECLGAVLSKSKRGEFVCVCSFFFLRFVCPALVSPHAFGLLKEPAPREASRQLLLFSKFITHLANVTSFTEDWMGPLNALLVEYQPKMLLFLQQICGPTPIVSQPSPTPVRTSGGASASASIAPLVSCSSAPSIPSPLASSSSSSSVITSAAVTSSGQAGLRASTGAIAGGGGSNNAAKELNKTVDLLAKAFKVHRSKLDVLLADPKIEEKYSPTELLKLRIQIPQLYSIISSYPDDLTELKGFPDEEKEAREKQEAKDREARDKEKEAKEREKESPVPKKNENRKSRLLELLTLGTYRDKDVERDASASPPTSSSIGDAELKPKTNVAPVGISSPASSPELRNSRDSKREKRVVSMKERPLVFAPLVPRFPSSVKTVNRSCIDDAEVLAWSAGLVDRPDEEIRRAGELIAVLIDEVRMLRGERHTHFRAPVHISPRVSPHPGAAGAGSEPERGRKMIISSVNTELRGSSLPPNTGAIVSRERSGAESRVTESKPTQSVLPRRVSGSRLDLSPMTTRPVHAAAASGPLGGEKGAIGESAPVVSAPMPAVSPVRSPRTAASLRMSNSGLAQSCTTPPLTSPSSPPIPSSSTELTPSVSSTPPSAPTSSPLLMSAAKLKAISSMHKFKIEKRPSSMSPLAPSLLANRTPDSSGPASSANISPRTSSPGVTASPSAATPIPTATEYNPFVSPRPLDNPFTSPRVRPVSLNAVQEIKSDSARNSAGGRNSDPSPVAPSVLSAVVTSDH